MNQQDKIHNAEEGPESQTLHQRAGELCPGLLYLLRGLIHLLQKLPTPVQNCTQTSVPSPLRRR